jgi:hypothetical protein
MYNMEHQMSIFIISRTLKVIISKGGDEKGVYLYCSAFYSSRKNRENPPFGTSPSIPRERIEKTPGASLLDLLLPF